MSNRDNRHVEDGMGFAGLAPTAAERREERERKAAIATAREQGIAEGIRIAAEIAHKWGYNAVLDRGRAYCTGWEEATVAVAEAIEAAAKGRK